MVGAFGKRKTLPKTAKAANRNQPGKASKPWKNNCGTSRKNKRRKRKSSARNSSKPSRKKSEKCCAGNGTPNASFRKHSEGNNVASNDFYSKIKGNPPGGFGSVRTLPMVSFCRSDFARRPPGIRKDWGGVFVCFPPFPTSGQFPKMRHKHKERKRRNFPPPTICAETDSGQASRRRKSLLLADKRTR